MAQRHRCRVQGRQRWHPVAHCAVIVGQIAHGASFEEILEDYPDLERDDIQQAIEYAAWLTHEQVHIA
ncbi:MAG: DUF433 domain-containing protein [bacterium]|nr:DUF433 domain-containing protein [bacterium]